MSARTYCANCGIAHDVGGGCGEYKPKKKELDAYTRRTQIDGAIRYLQMARDCLAQADAPRTLSKVRSALKSADGARRHAANRWFGETNATANTNPLSASNWNGWRK